MEKEGKTPSMFIVVVVVIVVNNGVHCHCFRKSIKGIAMNLSGRGGNMMGITPAYKINYIKSDISSRISFIINPFQGVP